MAQITLGGDAIQTAGNLPAAGSSAKDFVLVAGDLSEKSLKDFAGKKVIMNIFPSIDTGVCAASVRTFNEKAANLGNTQVLCISADLPFAQARFCGSEGIENVTNLSSFRSSFGADYGLTITTGPIQGLLSRAVIVLDEAGKVLYTEQVPEIKQEPNYAAAIAALA